MSPVFCMEEWTSRGASDTEHVRNRADGTRVAQHYGQISYSRITTPDRPSCQGVFCLSQRGAVRLRAAWTYRAGSVRVKSHGSEGRKPRDGRLGRQRGRISNRISKTQGLKYTAAAVPSPPRPGDNRERDSNQHSFEERGRRNGRLGLNAKKTGKVIVRLAESRLWQTSSRIAKTTRVRGRMSRLLFLNNSACCEVSCWNSVRCDGAGITC